MYFLEFQYSKCRKSKKKKLFLFFPLIKNSILKTFFDKFKVSYITQIIINFWISQGKYADKLISSDLFTHISKQQIKDEIFIA